MKILAIERELPETDGEDFKSHLRDEALKVWDLYQSGVIREIYFRQDQNSAVLMLECNNVTEAVNVLNKLPLVENNLITFDIIPLAPYPGFGRLFARS